MKSYGYLSLALAASVAARPASLPQNTSLSVQNVYDAVEGEAVTLAGAAALANSSNSTLHQMNSTAALSAVELPLVSDFDDHTDGLQLDAPLKSVGKAVFDVAPPAPQNKAPVNPSVASLRVFRGYGPCNDSLPFNIADAPQASTCYSLKTDPDERYVYSASILTLQPHPYPSRCRYEPWVYFGDDCDSDELKLAPNSCNEFRSRPVSGDAYIKPWMSSYQIKEICTSDK